MPRKTRQLVDGGVYHVICRGHNKCALFHSRHDYDIYKSILRKYRKEILFDLHHYCLMPNHVHLLIRISSGASLPKLMQGINQSYSQHYKRKYDMVGYLFQGRYKALLIEDDGYLLECGRYIERNPLKSGIENNLARYPFSSFSYYAKGERDDILTPNPLYLELSGSEEERRAMYLEYVIKERMEDRAKNSIS